MAILVSPGQSITVTDMSAYVSGAASTIPLVVLATEQDKTAPDGSLAYGTTMSNAGKLQSFTSQRELAAAMGYATFKQSSSGTPLNGNEQNEYGLLAAHSALGVSNSLYAIRADVDLKQLNATSVRPDSPPANGTYWLDLSTTSWGINEWNIDSTGGSFTRMTPTVITDTADLVSGIPKSSIGTIGSYAVVVASTDNGMFYKNSNNTWVQVGSTDWQNSYVTVQGTVTNPTFVANSVMTVNGTTVNLTTATTLSGVVGKINTAAITGITAAAVSGQLAFYVDSTAKSDGYNADGQLLIVDGAHTPLANAGITPGRFYSPQVAHASYVGVPNWRTTDVTPAPSGSVYIKTSVQGNGMNLSIKKYNATAGTWTSLAVPVYSSSAEAIATLDVSGGGNGIAGGSVFARYYISNNRNLVGLRLMSRNDGPKTVVTGNSPSGNFTVGNSYTIQVTQLGLSTLASATVSLSGTGVSDFVASTLLALGQAGIDYVSAAVTSAGTITFTHQYGGEIVLNNVAGTPLTTAGFTTSTTGVRSDPATTGLVLSNWVPFGAAGTFSGGVAVQPYTYSFYTPYQAPSDGTLWYYGSAADVDVMINNGGWKGYKLVSSDARGYNLTNTDPGGVIVSASQPTTQSDNTSLVAGDLWLDSSDLVNYPAFYRYNGTKFVAIDRTDQTGQNGILFADARWDTDGTTDVVTGAYPLITSLLTSNYIDQDAPDYRLYPRGMLLFNTRRSGFNVKQYVSNYFNATSFPTTPAVPNAGNNLPVVAATWQTVSGNKFDGSMYAGPAAQRVMVTKAMQSAIAASTEIREEQFAFNIICAPGYPELIAEMVGLNNDRANTAFVIGDTPMTLAPNAVDITNWSNDSDGTGLATADPYLGVYYPSAVSSDVKGNTVIVPPSHIMLRTFIRNDSVSYPWFAPAGVRRGLVDNATDLGYINTMTGEFVRNSISQGLRDAMYQQKVNPITILPGVGMAVWGQKTRNAMASSMDRVNVARLINYIRTILAKVGNAYLFEPNDKITRDQIKRNIEGAMNDLVAKRGIYDYLVVCDTSNNTPQRIAGNELWVDIAIEPVKDVEFIYIPIRLLNPGSIAAGQLGK
jgi:hypothetical protein